MKSAAAIANRKALTWAARPSFREMSVLLGSLDKLVLRFRKTDAGSQFVDAHLAMCIDPKRNEIMLSRKRS